MGKKFRFGMFFDNLINNITVYILIFMVVMVFINACMRYIFHAGIMVNEELARFSFVWMSMLGGVVAYKNKSHIRITILLDGIRSVRVRGIIYGFSRIVTTGVIVFLMYGAVLYVKKASEYINAGLPVNWAFVVCIVLIMSVAMFITDIVDCCRYIIGKMNSSHDVAGSEGAGK